MPLKQEQKGLLEYPKGIGFPIKIPRLHRYHQQCIQNSILNQRFSPSPVIKLIQEQPDGSASWDVDVLMLFSTFLSSSGLLIRDRFPGITRGDHGLSRLRNHVAPPTIMVPIFVLLFVISYGVLVGNTAWTSADLSPLEVWSMSWFLSMLKALSPSGTFGYTMRGFVDSVICALSSSIRK